MRLTTTKSINEYLCKSVILLLLLLIINLDNAGQEKNARRLLVTERQLREKLKVEMLPRYPKNALKSKAQGVVVSIVEFDTQGTILKVEVVQTPHPLLGLATEQALKKWRFYPIIHY